MADHMKEGVLIKGRDEYGGIIVVADLQDVGTEREVIA